MPPTGIKKQKTFSHRRHISKPRASLGSEKEKRQSSLTQLDFVSTPQTSEIIPISSDNDEDEDFVVEQPRKRRRISAKGSDGEGWTPKTGSSKSSVNRPSARLNKRIGLERGQQTMTQIDFVPSVQRSRAVDDIEDDDEEDYRGDNVDESKSPTAMRRLGTRRTLPWSTQSNDETEHVPQSPIQSPSRDTLISASDSHPDLALHSIATHDFTTPKKSAHHLEIPSSQSPPSIKMSIRRSHKPQHDHLSQKSPSKSPSPSKVRNLRRTPLAEKSVNIAKIQWQPESQESQNPTMKMLQQVRLRTRLGGAPLHEEAPMPPPKIRPERRVTVRTSQSRDLPAEEQALPRKLRRTTTVQDSQASDENIMTQMPPRALTRTLTVQDSQHEDLDLSSQLYRSMSSRENLRVIASQADNDFDDENEAANDGKEDDEEIEDVDYPHTFDPVSAALERDAARYAWTQTQAPRTQHTKTQVMDSEDDSDDDDLDRGIVPDSESEDEIILLPSPSAQDGPSQELCSEDMVEPVLDGKDSENKERTPKPNATIHKRLSPSPPSSPPPVRTSQVSTVVPTQSSPRLALPAGRAEADGYSPPTSTHATPKQIMIKKPQYHDTQAFTISSSPLPLPPWSSSGEVDLGLYTIPKGEKMENTGNDLASLVDFSLPPPPPLGMSSSPWR